MKKKTMFLILLLLCFANSYNYAYSIETKNSDYEIIQSDIPEEINNNKESTIDSIFETDKVKILKVKNKYAIYDKESNSLILEPIIDEITSFNENEYKIKVGKLIGYVNIETKNNFMTNYDNIYLFGKYLKTKKLDKYGLIDKDGNVILKPIYDRVGVLYNENKEYISGKYDGKYRLYQNTGRLIPEEELYIISNDSYYLLAQNLKPELKKYRYNNSTIYQKVESSKENMIYEIEEIKLPEKVKAAAIKKDVIEDDIENNSIDTEKEIFTVNNKQYILIKKDEKYGINTLKGKEIVPVRYDEIIPTKPCKHYKQPVFLTIREGIYSQYSSKGQLLAEQVYDKINIYKFGQLYTYTNENGFWNLRCNGKLIGQLTIENGNYKYTKTKFHLFGIHKINELFISILENAK